MACFISIPYMKQSVWQKDQYTLGNLRLLCEMHQMEIHYEVNQDVWP